MRPAASLTRQVLFLVAWPFLLNLTALPQQQNVMPAAPGQPTTTSTAATAYPFHPITEWEGQRFIFLSCPKASAESAYQDFNGRRLRKDYAGRIAKIVSVSDFSGRQHIDIEMEDTGERLRARTSPNRESVEGLLLVSDLEHAKQEWKGKTLWTRQMRLFTYDESSDELGGIVTPRYCALKVVDIQPGWDAEKPLRFWLETADGKRGFVDLNLSGTNVPPELRAAGRFNEYFMTEDPHLKYKWSSAQWAAIENNRILTGMTAEQVRMSWGEPNKTARTATGEQWTYSSGVLNFNKNGILTDWQ